MRLLPFQAVDLNEVGTIAFGGWLFGSAVFGAGFALVTTGAGVLNGEWSILLMLPQLLFVALFGAGLLSVPLVMPTALLLAALLRTLAVGRLPGALACFGVGCGYALGLSSLPRDWQWWSDFWYAAPTYGAAMGSIYARTVDA